VLLISSLAALAQGRSDEALLRALLVQTAHTDRLLQISGVVGTATGLNEANVPVVKVFVAHPGAAAGLPGQLNGVQVSVDVTGPIVAFAPPAGKPNKPGGGSINPKGRFDRPVPIGVSVGNATIGAVCSAGTISCRVIKGNNVYALGNNHVFALENSASVGSPVHQPGPYDTGCAVSSSDLIGTLSDFVPIVFSTSANNEVDAAIVLSSVDVLGNATPGNGYGTPSSTPVEEELDLFVKKYGRTTSLTTGKITGLNATLNIGYSSGTARFVKQIIIQGSKGPFSKAGDSGALIVTSEGNNPVGLLFAGSSTVTIANPIGLVLQKLNITIDGGN
jgi:hypothetical protein